MPCARLTMQEEIARLKAELQARQQAGGGPEVHGSNQASMLSTWRKTWVGQVKSYSKQSCWLVHAGHTCPAGGELRAGPTKHQSTSAMSASNCNCKQLYHEQ